MLTEHLRKQDTSRQLTLWCSACSTGEEAYSMAMTAVEALGGYEQKVHIVASDLDTKVLQTAREGVYKADAVAKLPAHQVERFFQRGTGSQSGYMLVKPELKRMIDFRCINLLATGWPVHAPLDVIFCRNVMIYFDKETQLSILKKFAPLLRENGLLFAGHSESFYHASAIFRLRGNTVYELTNQTGVK
jgi:chemotaxis protein methyltransferase CheR